MSYFSIEFFLFLLFFLAVYLTSKKGEYKNYVISVFSLLFYYLLESRYFYLLPIIAISDFYLGRLIYKHPRFSRLLLLGCWIKNIIPLFVFKFGHANNEFVLPIGLSFFAFQSLSYVQDLHFKKVTPATSLIDYFAFVSLFPQLISGPICRASQILPQLKSKNKPTSDEVYIGVSLIAVGSFKKLLVADYLGEFVNLAFSDVTRIDSAAYWLLVTFAFSIQIYFDFMAYTDIARGIGKLCGIEIPRNFYSPYFSKSLSEFWNRWHVSLSSWFKDYVYIPLGGNRLSGIKTHMPLLVTFSFSGLWHGADITFFLWGLFHGLLVLIERVTKSEKVNSSFSFLMTFLSIQIGWILFRVNNLSDFFRILNYLLSPFNSKVQLSILQSFPHIITILFLAVLWDFYELKLAKSKNKISPYLVFILIILTFTFKHQELMFIYFRF